MKIIKKNSISLIANNLSQSLIETFLKKPSCDLYENEIENIKKAQYISDVVCLLSDYLVKNHIYYRTLDGCRAYYPGYNGIYGKTQDSIEGISRVSPILAAILHSDIIPENLKSKTKELLLETLQNAFNPSHNGYWGNPVDRSPLICEAADVALALYLSWDYIQKSLLDTIKMSIYSWLESCIDKNVQDNNWHLFNILIDLVLSKLYPDHTFRSEWRIERVLQFYLGDGCFRDGLNGRFDSYNSWAFHYNLFWIYKISPELLPDYPTILAKYCDWYKYLFSKRGVPVFGRSLCYRMAVAVPLLADAAVTKSVLSKNFAVDAFINSQMFFINRDSLRFGAASQGVYKDDIRFLDVYSGPASSMWGFRALILYLVFFSGEFKQRKINSDSLVADAATFDINVESIDVKIFKHQKDDYVEVIFLKNKKNIDEIKIKKRSISDLMKNAVYGIPYRPNNNLLAKGLRSFTVKTYE